MDVPASPQLQYFTTTQLARLSNLNSSPAFVFYLLSAVIQSRVALSQSAVSPGHVSDRLLSAV